MDKKTKAAVTASTVSLQAAREAAAKLWANHGEEDESERFNDRVNEVPACENAANEILETLAPLRDIDSAPGEHAQALADALSTAGTVEKETDLDANLAEAMEHAEELRKTLLATKKFLKEADDDQQPGEDDKAVAEEAIKDALQMLRDLVTDIKFV